MSTIKCTIEYASLANVPEYVAISYAWGDAGNQKSIYLDGIQKSISASLFGALSALRDREKEVLVWADALCINQQNMAEKSSQIKLMTSIYKKAESVAVWLGPEADNSPSAFRFLKELSESDSISPGERSRSWTISREDEKNLAAVARLFSRSYWKRLWVVQEVFNAADIVVYCGSDKISWRVLSEASSALHRYESDLDDQFAKISSPHHVQAIFNEGPRSLLDPNELRDEDKVLLDVLRRCRRKVSDKPQDKVFGLLGVLPEAIQKDFSVDYTRSVKEVFTDVVDFLVHTTASLDVICESINFSEHSNPANLPSWVPDWSYNPILKSLSSSYVFSASAGTEAEIQFHNHRNELEISGIHLDTIQKYGVSVATQCTLADYLMAFLHWRALLVETFGPIKKNAGSKMRHEEFCRVLNLSQDHSERPDDEWMQTCYHVFSSLIQERLPRLEIDSELRSFAKARTFVHHEDRRQFLQETFESIPAQAQDSLSENNVAIASPDAEAENGKTIEQDWGMNSYYIALYMGNSNLLCRYIPLLVTA
ncbi:hypothetical protein E8E14_004187 [Neopestalotiopsis sp. 37M]|nr:hypothetical protein E8E14_004187 [Neopestalotiopsis sp. 37M]